MHWEHPTIADLRCCVPCPLLVRWESRATLRRFSTPPSARSHSPSLLSARLRLLLARNDSYGHRTFPSLLLSSSSPAALLALPSDGTCGHRDPLRPVLAQHGAPSAVGATRRWAVAAAPAGARGQADLACFRPSQVAPWVRKCPWVLHRLSLAAVGPSPATTVRFPQRPMLLIRARDVALKFEKMQGPKCIATDSCE
jgi:hypothetical protein